MPSSLRWLAALVMLSIVVAATGGGVLYYQARSQTRIAAAQITHGDIDAGRAAIGRYGCGSCHEIPGIAGAVGRVGPSLREIATRAEIAGKRANDPGSMTAWLMHPQRVAPGSGMPEMGVTEHDARDIAAYLYTLD